MDLQIKEIINSDTALSPDSGLRVYDVLDSAISKSETVELDFSGIEVMTSAFLNAAIGQLYSKFSSEDLNLYLKVRNLPVEDRALLKKVIERAKDYFKDKRVFDERMNQRYENE